MDNPGISRITRTKEDARVYYDKLSGWYDLLAGIAEYKYKKAGVRELNIKDGDKVLEIGFGTGECVISMAKLVNDGGKVYGIDLSEGMLKITQSKVHKAGLSDRVELTCGDAINLPYDNDSMDAIFSSFTLELFDTPEIPVVLNQCYRVLAPNGRFSLVGMVKKRQSNLMGKLYEWAHEKFPKVVDCRPIFLQEALEQTGFSIINVLQKSMYGLPVEIILARVKK